MTELEKRGIYATTLPMPGFDKPISEEWVGEIGRQVDMGVDDEVYLVGHSLGATAILNYLQNEIGDHLVNGVVLVSAPIEKTDNSDLDNFFEAPLDFEFIRLRSNKFSVIHGDNDVHVPVSQAKKLSEELGSELILIPNGGHLSGAEGFYALPEVLDSLLAMFG